MTKRSLDDLGIALVTVLILLAVAFLGGLMWLVDHTGFLGIGL